MIELLLQIQAQMEGRLWDRDGGPIYEETRRRLDELIVEPLNGISAALFLLIVAYFVWLLRGKYRKHTFMTVSLGILAIGGIGGTIYHLFRLYPIFLYMDWVPIMILCLAACVFFFVRAGGQWWVAAMALLSYFGISTLLFASINSENPILPPQLLVNINYALMAILVLGPVYYILYKTNFYKRQWVIYALLAFLAAITFRMLDASDWVRLNLEGIGTHFLWHTFGAVACFAIFRYVYEVGEMPEEQFIDFHQQQPVKL